MRRALDMTQAEFAELMDLETVSRWETGARGTGKPLQIAVASAPGTTEATQHPGTRLQPCYLRRRGRRPVENPDLAVPTGNHRPKSDSGS